ncbi:hypothetical protein HDV03_001609 [Kappamyces sp. JEL0829]|nr:hypothetical protein HDV03_001609 [Kappamyces sp. JEL0829]KAJ3373746.1 hypothetical protein HDU91_004282 [Kappamyces sp. JEL0680]
MSIFAALKYAGPAAFIGIGGYGAYEFNSNPNHARNFMLWKELGPVISHYRLVEFRFKYFPPKTEQEEEEAYMKLHLKYSSRVMETLRDLRGFYIKVAQVMANRSDMLHPMYIEKLRTLEGVAIPPLMLDAVPHLLNPQQAKEYIVEKLGLGSLEEAFVDFQDEPIGSASIGQVHKAYLKRNGKPVAIKIQGPGSEELFRYDIAAARDFCTVFAPEQVAIFNEIEKQFLTVWLQPGLIPQEFDYRAEAMNLDIIADNMKPFSRNVVVPRPYMDLCSKEILTMEYLKGPKLVDGAREKGRQYAAILGKTFEQLEQEFKDDIAKNGMPPPYNGPSAFTLEVYRRLVMAKDTCLNAPIYVANASLSLVSYVTGWKVKKWSYFSSFIPLNSSFIMKALLDAHGHQLLVNGFFNADPHPGNFLLMPDGRIAMLDYGQVKRLTDQERLFLARFVVAVADRNEKDLLQLYKETGYKSKYMNTTVMTRVAVVVFDRDGRDVCDGLNLQQFIDKMYAMDPWEETSDFLVMPIRLSLLMRGVGLMLNHPVSVCTAWKPIAQKAVKELQAKLAV